ncbi:hypothetical protein [Guptibacillus hwajinpoensis]|uniref:hypothetical protein n=1 Tax=Guptibacillus hwajinpoensis TaxID=208199 RepID=UPI0037369ED9
MWSLFFPCIVEGIQGKIQNQIYINRNGAEEKTVKMGGFNIRQGLPKVVFAGH